MKLSGGFYEKGKCLISARHKKNNVQGIHMNNDVICVQHKGDCSCFALLLLFRIILSKEMSHLITNAQF